MNLLNENMFAPIVVRIEQVGTKLEFRLFFGLRYYMQHTCIHFAKFVVI